MRRWRISHPSEYVPSSGSVSAALPAPSLAALIPKIEAMSVLPTAA
jgi:hypothetical protein